MAFLLDAAAGASVLDVGCNRGLVGYEFARCGASLIHGIDKNPQAIATAKHLFDDVDCTSKFILWDLANGLPTAVGLAHEYTFVLMLGVVHKLRRVMSPASLEKLIDDLAARTKACFAWNGFADEFAMIDRIFSGRGFKIATRHQSPAFNVAVWERQ